MKTKLAIVALASMVSVAAWAGGMSQSATGAVGGAGASTTARMQFSKLDRNHDGYISKKEAKANPQLYKEWKQADTNRDGKLDQAEFAQFETGGAMGGSMQRRK